MGRRKDKDEQGLSKIELRKAKRAERRKKEAAKKAAKEAAKANGGNTKNGNGKMDINLNGGSSNSGIHKKPIYTATGLLNSSVMNNDVKITSYSLTLSGQRLIDDTTLMLLWGKRYGIIGPNGCGKSTMLQSIGDRALPIPDHFDIYYVAEEAPPVKKTAVEFVLADVDSERERLEKLCEQLMSEGDTEDDGFEAMLESITERIEDLDVDTAGARAAVILHGLGFSTAMQRTACKNFSGGWRMRIALAKALFKKPTLLLLDEPTNHLDLEACVWLENYLANWHSTLILVSHSQDFLNNVCTNIIYFRRGKLEYYTGNYDMFIKTKSEKEERQMKQYNWEQEEIRKMKEYIARFGHGSAKLARQAQSKEKTLKKMIDKGLTEKVSEVRTFSFRFPVCSKLPPPVMQFKNVDFGYKNGPRLFKGLDFGFDLDSRIALVGRNGAGKSTLLKLMTGKIAPTNDGFVSKHNKLRIAWYHQHLTELLDPDLTPLQFMVQEFPDVTGDLGNSSEGVQLMRKAIGRFGLTKNTQVTQIHKLSDGQQSRVVFAWLAFTSPHLLLLDEPTNHLDIETIDSLADAINHFNGGMILVSHDFRLIDQVAKEIWEVKDGNIVPWKGSIQKYKSSLVHDMKLEEDQYKKNRKQEDVDKLKTDVVYKE